MTNEKGITYRLMYKLRYIQYRLYINLIKYVLTYKLHRLISLQLGKMNVINIALLRGK